ncbi:MAG: hypothetical protein IPM47_05380 [Sphingobacteriales bacterium]|nr:MAG: hypothetical protein IPM47_05380 [Sphingobacteriales bacterium]
MVSSEWIIDNLKEYISENDVNLRHGWIQIKMDRIIYATNEEFREKAMDEIESIISKPYFISVSTLDALEITEDEFWSRAVRYTDVLQILRNIRSEYKLPKSFPIPNSQFLIPNS